MPNVTEQVSLNVPRGTTDADVDGRLRFLEIGEKLHAALVERAARSRSATAAASCG